MIDALFQMIALDFPFGANGNDREIDVTVGQISRRPNALDDLQPE
jgi:hypothetical protein